MVLDRSELRVRWAETVRLAREGELYLVDSLPEVRTGSVHEAAVWIAVTDRWLAFRRH